MGDCFAVSWHSCIIWKRVFHSFQQASAASHRAKDTVALLHQETPDFIPSRSLAA